MGILGRVNPGNSCDPDTNIRCCSAGIYKGDAGSGGPKTVWEESLVLISNYSILNCHFN